jgi:glutamate formiminotransferase
VVDEIARAISRAGAQILDRQMDADHNRSVITFVAEPAAAERAAFDSIQTAARLISLETHEGEHPRIGATDVVPFIPLRDVTMLDCVAMARRLGERVGAELGIPVYLYGNAAARAERRDLANIRRGEYEMLKTGIASNPDRSPDYGPRRVGYAGAVAIGARDFLIAFNVNLATSDLKIAKAIAQVVREKNGGLKGVKAKGFMLHSRHLAQVSMNLTDYRATGMLVAFNRVKFEAEKRGVQIVESELVGLAPIDAVAQTAALAVHLPRLRPEQILEMKIFENVEQA